MTSPSLRPTFLCRTLPALFLLALTAHARAEPEYPNLEAACANNPDKCAQVRAKIDAKCKEDPAACAEKKARLDKRIGELKTKCAANPEACAEKKAKLRERMEQRRQNAN